MSPLAELILNRLRYIPLSRGELLEDLGLNQWEEEELEYWLRDLEASGQVRRLEAPAREEAPFYGRSLEAKKPGD